MEPVHKTSMIAQQQPSSIQHHTANVAQHKKAHNMTPSIHTYSQNKPGIQPERNVRVNINRLYSQNAEIWEKMGINAEEAKKQKIIERIVGVAETEEQVNMAIQALSTAIGNFKSIEGAWNKVKSWFGANDTKDIKNIVKNAQKIYAENLKNKFDERGFWGRLFNRKNLREKFGINDNEKNPQIIHAKIKSYIDKTRPQKTDSRDERIRKTKEIKNTFCEIVKHTEGDDIVYIVDLIKYLQNEDRELAANVLHAMGNVNPELKSRVAKEIGFQMVEMAVEHPDPVTGKRMEQEVVARMGIKISANLNKNDALEYTNKLHKDANFRNNFCTEIAQKLHAGEKISPQDMERYNQYKENQQSYSQTQSTLYASNIVGTSMNLDLSEEDKNEVRNNVVNHVKNEGIEETVYQKANRYIKEHASNVDVAKFEADMNMATDNKYSKIVYGKTTEKNATINKEKNEKQPSNTDKGKYSKRENLSENNNTKQSNKHNDDKEPVINTKETKNKLEQKVKSDETKKYQANKVETFKQQQVNSTDLRVNNINISDSTEEAQSQNATVPLLQNCNTVKEVMEQTGGNNSTKSVAYVLANRHKAKASIINDAKQMYANMSDSAQSKVLMGVSMYTLEDIIKDTKTGALKESKAYFVNSKAVQLIKDEEEKRREKNNSTTQNKCA